MEKVLVEMSSIHDSENDIIVVMDVFLARLDTKPKASLLCRLLDPLVAEWHQLLDSPTFQL